VPHIIITSLRLSADNKTLPSRPPTPDLSHPSIAPSETLTVIGSTSRSDGTPRLFRIDIPAIPIFFSGTGDMFAGLMVARMREAAAAAGVLNTARWQSPDSVDAVELPIAKAAEKVLASMQAILEKTAISWKSEVEKLAKEDQGMGLGKGEESEQESAMKRHIQQTKAAEVKVIRNKKDLIDPPDVGRYQAKPVLVSKIGGTVGEPEKDELGVVKLAGAGEGAIQLSGPAP
jgi:pyridoxine kinase